MDCDVLRFDSFYFLLLDTVKRRLRVIGRTESEFSLREAAGFAIVNDRWVGVSHLEAYSRGRRHGSILRLTKECNRK